MVDDWVEREMLRGLQGLFALRLSGAPAADALGMTADVWLVAIEHRARGWQEGRDAERIRRAFALLFGRVRQWPSPAEFIDVLPSPEPLPALPEPKLTAGQRAQNRRRYEELIRNVFKKVPQ